MNDNDGIGKGLTVISVLACVSLVAMSYSLERKRENLLQKRIYPLADTDHNKRLDDREYLQLASNLGVLSRTKLQELVEDAGLYECQRYLENNDIQQTYMTMSREEFKHINKNN